MVLQFFLQALGCVVWHTQVLQLRHLKKALFSPTAIGLK